MTSKLVSGHPNFNSVNDEKIESERGGMMCRDEKFGNLFLLFFEFGVWPIMVA